MKRTSLLGLAALCCALSVPSWADGRGGDDVLDTDRPRGEETADSDSGIVERPARSREDLDRVSESPDAARDGLDGSRSESSPAVEVPVSQPVSDPRQGAPAASQPVQSDLGSSRNHGGMRAEPAAPAAAETASKDEGGGFWSKAKGFMVGMGKMAIEGSIFLGAGLLLYGFATAALPMMALGAGIAVLGALLSVWLN